MLIFKNDVKLRIKLKVLSLKIIMNNQIKRIYLGLPDSFKETVFWVGRKYRTNLLSHSPGGGDIIVEYHNGKILGYDWIKYPSRYVQNIFIKLFFRNDTTFEQYKEYDQVKIIKKEISKVFTRIYEKDEFETVPFEEVWNSEIDNTLPWNNIEEYVERIKERKASNQQLPPLHLYDDELLYDSFENYNYINSYGEKKQLNRDNNSISNSTDYDDLPF